ncbi:hypothetical protein PVAP13_3KG532116 [Panicum virgatum]|uniref:Uncharacterized protein n=1 Tax=Panicum virgatum TaxID=38727 RepID=A0A8T0V5P1_PANVG|nr:hypothetical protein PVAP13_3KG532116 [Panicum virgatum]
MLLWLCSLPEHLDVHRSLNQRCLLFLPVRDTCLHCLSGCRSTSRVLKAGSEITSGSETPGVGMELGVQKRSLNPATCSIRWPSKFLLLAAWQAW